MLTQTIVTELALPLSARERGLLQHDVPASARGYELYLRANHATLEMRRLPEARDLYVEAVKEDPSYAPAWARLGRCYRMLGKYILRDAAESAEHVALAEKAFQKALELNPDLPLTQSLYAQLEIDIGRAADAMARLLARARVAGSEADIFPGLVHACRYGGLLDASVAADRRARELDANAGTSIAHTHFAQRDYERAQATDLNAEVGYLQAQCLASLGREREALELLRDREATYGSARIGMMIRSLRLLLDGAVDEGTAASLEAARAMSDGEAVYYLTRQLARSGRPADALTALKRTLDFGYFCLPGIQQDPWLDGLRREPGFVPLAQRLADGHQRALVVFADADGPGILGMR